jgi:hypothetical protein
MASLMLGVLFFLLSGISLWLLVLLAIPCYSLTMRDACLLKLNGDQFDITPLNPFIGNSSIHTKSIINVNSFQSIEPDDYNVYGAPYFVTKRKYRLDYTNSKKTIDTTFFSISNEEKEKIILKELRLAMALSQ